MDILATLQKYSGPSMGTYLVLCLSLFMAIFSICFCFSCRRNKLTRSSESHEFIASRARFIHKTQILKCNISHRRLFPAQHGFTYPCLSVGIPVRNPSSSWILSVDEIQWWKRGWLHVTAKDHFGRESEGKTLSEALDQYLERQGLDPKRFPYAYLLTTPRLLNYRFSPASFWYLYTANFDLCYVIAEVNNTFNERRVYLFPVREHRRGTFKQKVAKDFHVSPFNSRKGTYQLSTSSPERVGNVSMKITLFSSKGHPKLVARWWSDAPPIDPSESSVQHLFWCLVGWGWTVLITFPRIVYEALLLAQVHNLHIWYRPEPRESAIPRKAIAAERFLASTFVSYLRFLVSKQERALNIMIWLGGLPNCVISPEPTNIRQPPQWSSGLAGYLEMRIHGPNFYRQLLHSRMLTDLLSHAMLHPLEENRTVWSNKAELLMLLLQEAEDSKLRCGHTQTTNASQGRTIVAVSLSVAWVAHRMLMPAAWGIAGVYPNPGFPKERICTSNVVPRVTRSSSPHPNKQCFLHVYVRNHCSAPVQAQYMAATVYLYWATLISNVIGGE